MRQSSNYKAITEFIIENREYCYRLAFSYTKNQEDALDIVQESIVKALSKSKALDKPEYVKTWFYKILVNTALDFLRKNNRLINTDPLLMEIYDEGTEDNYADFDLQKAIDSLPENNRTIIILRFFEDLPLQEISEIVGDNISTVKSKLYSSLKKLKITLNSDESVT